MTTTSVSKSEGSLTGGADVTAESSVPTSAFVGSLLTAHSIQGVTSLRTLRKVLEQQWAEHGTLKKRGVICPWVFHRNGKRIKIIKHCWDTACKLAGCPGRIPHDLRRTAIRAMVRAGISEHTAMMMSGHKTASVFRRYAIVSTQDLTEAAAKLAAASGQ